MSGVRGVVVSALVGLVLVGGSVRAEPSCASGGGDIGLPSAVPLNVVLISDAVAQAEQIRLAAAPGTIAIIYRSEDMTVSGLVDLLASVRAARNGAQIGHLGIVAHGGPGEIAIGKSNDLSLATMPAQTGALKQLRFLLTKDARLDLYACSVANGVGGKTFVDDLAAITGAAVFASDNPVGTVPGADLAWEYHTGQAVTSEDLFAAQGIAMVRGVCLSNVTVTLYMHQNSPSGAYLTNALVVAKDGAGATYEQLTTNGYVAFTGAAGTWSFVASQSGWQATSWQSTIATTTTFTGGYLLSQSPLSAAQVASDAYQAQFRGGNLVVAVAVANPESSYYIGATNVNSAYDSNWANDDNVDRGLWQINGRWNPYWSQTDQGARLLTDQVYNAQAAYSISTTGPSYWENWYGFTKAALQNSQARTAAAGVDSTVITGIGNSVKANMGCEIRSLTGSQIGAQIDSESAGGGGTIIDGPVVSDISGQGYWYIWWKVRWDDGKQDGWVAEASQSGSKLIRTTSASTRIISLSGNLAFGNVAVGLSAHQTMTIYNNGNSALTVSGISYPSGFSGSWSGSIAAGGSQLVVVTFSPTSATSYNGTVSVNSDATSGTNTIAASGTGTTAVLPNLTPYQPSGWSDKIVVSNVGGTHTDSSPLFTTDNLYVDWAVTNNGAATINTTFYVALYIDGSYWYSWPPSIPMGPGGGYYWEDCNIGQLSAGTHTLQLVADSTGVISESNESDNSYTKTITVQAAASLPNLTPYQPSGWSDKIVVSNTSGTNTDSNPLYTSDNLYVDWGVTNNGAATINTTFYVALYIDGSYWYSWPPSIPMYSGGWYYWQDCNIGQLSAGTHTLQLVVDSTGVISESNESDNSYTKTITVQPAPVGPPNDNFSNRIVISASGGTTTGTNTGATKESGEPNHANVSGGKSVWWTWTPTSSGSAQIDTIGSSFDTILGVYTGNSVSALTAVASDDDGGGNLTSKVIFSVTAGTTYQIAVDGFYGASGNITLNVIAPVPTPAITSPMPISTLTSSSVTFQWSSGSGVSEYFLYVGTAAGANDIYGQSAGLSLSATVTNLPTDGRTLYVRLWWYTSVGWQYTDYVYTAFTQRLTGDINGDGYVNVGDLQILVASWGMHASGLAADLNNDSYVNVGDLQLLVANWGQHL